MPIEFIKDVLLIALCGASAFYCWMLSQRLKKLNNLKSGVGASIVTLTEAIERTHDAAKTSRAELFESIEQIKELLVEAEAKVARLDAAMSHADSKIAASERANADLTKIVETDVPEARRKALKTTEALLKVLSDMQRMHAMMPESKDMAHKDAA